jgi:hypothetical protein
MTLHSIAEDTVELISLGAEFAQDDLQRGYALTAITAVVHQHDGTREDVRKHVIRNLFCTGGVAPTDDAIITC